MFTAITTILGAMSTILPAILRFFELKQEYAHKEKMFELQMEAVSRGLEFQMDIEDIKADVNEGESLRAHDIALDGGQFFNTLRASVRPVITYIMFLLFVVVKFSAAYVMIQAGSDIPTMLLAVWDSETMAIFGSIIGFWFGSRAIEKWMRYQDNGGRFVKRSRYAKGDDKK